MKTITTFLASLCILVHTNIHSQNISGKVYDLETHEVLPFANIVLYDGNMKLLAGTAADLEGNYTFKDLHEGEYIFEISYVGYESYTESLHVVNNTKLTKDFYLIVYSVPDCVVEIVSYKNCEPWICHGIVCSTSCFGDTSKHESKKQVSQVNKKTAKGFIFPNPASQWINVTSKQEGLNIHIFNQFGQEVYQGPLLEHINQINISHYAEGMYTVQYVNAQNKLVDTGRFVVVHR